MITLQVLLVDADNWKPSLTVYNYILRDISEQSVIEATLARTTFP